MYVQTGNRLLDCKQLDTVERCSLKCKFMLHNARGDHAHLNVAGAVTKMVCIYLIVAQARCRELAEAEPAAACVKSCAVALFTCTSVVA